MSKPLILFDEFCYLCQQTKSIFQPLDWFRHFHWHSLQAYEKDRTLTRKQVEEFKKELHILFSNGECKRGYEAVSYLMLHCPFTFVIGGMMSLPGMERIGNPIYRWVARNRYRFFKKKCNNGACRL